VLTRAAQALTEPGAPWGGRLPSDFRTRDELTRLAETFNGLIGRLEDAAARERRFTANAAHELLTPLATLRSEAEVALRREREPSAYREALARVVDDVAHLTATVRGLLELARAEALSRTPEVRLDLGRLVRDRATRIRDAADAAGLSLDVEVDDGVRVAAEAAPLAEVVDNLLRNAVKYTPPGGRVRVHLSHDHPTASDEPHGVARLEVADTGAGFDPAACDRLFDRFYRSDQPEVQAERGSGLGLSIVKAIAEAYGGAAGCASDGPGRGSRFWVELPCLGARGDG
jgi:signal transduction histidine kinase